MTLHSKFRNVDACQNFASSYLNFYAPISDDFTESDDTLSFPYAPDDDHSGNEGYGDDHQAGDEGYGDDHGGSYGEGGGGDPQVLAHRVRHGAEPKVPATVRATAAVPEPVSAMGAAVGAPAQVDAATRNVKASSVSGGNGPLRNVQLLRDAEQAQREYAFTQLRNNVCTYDEKYGLWVKTSCHGKLPSVSHLCFFWGPSCCTVKKRVAHHIGWGCELRAYNVH
jgi:hypothetical protein